MKKNIDRISSRERKYVTDVLNSDFRASSGANMMQRLERSFAEKFGVKYSIGFINGTATLHIGLAAAGIGPGDEVIVPPLTMSSTAFSVLQQNALPVFADVDLDTFNISAKSIEKMITPRTKAIIPVALYGLSPDFDEINDIAVKFELIILEDDAQCFLGKYKEKLVGTLGDMASFSFQSSKHMTSGEGGMLITNDSILASEIRKYSSLGYQALSAKKGKITKRDIQDPKYLRHASLGFNYRIPELCSAVALGQLENLEELVQRRIDVANEYKQIIKNCTWLKAQFIPNGYKSSYWTFAATLEHQNITWYQFRDKFLELGGDGIYGAWQLTYLEPAFKNFAFMGKEKLFKPPIHPGISQKYDYGLCPNAERIQPKMLQFKTNYWKWDRAEEIFGILDKTIRYFN
jgi:perosamine synthetase